MPLLKTKALPVSDVPNCESWVKLAFEPVVAEWRNWQTHQTQNLAKFTLRVGSTPTSATTLVSKKDT